MMRIVDNNSLRKRMNEFLEAYYRPNPKVFTEEIGIHYSHYNRWIKGEREFGDESIQKVDEFLIKEGF